MSNTPGTEAASLGNTGEAGDLRERVAKSLAAGDTGSGAHWVEMSGRMQDMYLRFADHALEVVRPALDELAGEGLAIRHELGDRDTACDMLRSELADVTAQRDRLLWQRDTARVTSNMTAEEYQQSIRRAEAAEDQRDETEASARLYLRERNEAYQERDDAIRCTATVEAERDALVSASLQTDYTQDHDCGTAEDDPDAYEVALANITEMNRVLAVRQARLLDTLDGHEWSATPTHGYCPATDTVRISRLDLEDVLDPYPDEPDTVSDLAAGRLRHALQTQTTDREDAP